MKIRLICKDKNTISIEEILNTNGIDIDNSADIVLVEDGLDKDINCDVKIVFTMNGLYRFIYLISSFVSDKELSQIILGKKNEAYTPIKIEDIVFINAINNTVFVNTSDRSQFVIKPKLYQLEHVLLPGYFIRINKSEIANIKKISKIVPMFKGKLIIYLEGYKNPLDISRSYTKAFKERLGL